MVAGTVYFARSTCAILRDRVGVLGFSVSILYDWRHGFRLLFTAFLGRKSQKGGTVYLLHEVYRTYAFGQRYGCKIPALPQK